MDKVDPKLNRDLIAAYMSLLPGLGHMSKHHFGLGAAIMLMGTPIVLFAAGLLGAATLGVAFIVLPAIWWLGIAMHAYNIEDLTNPRRPDQPPPEED